MRLKVGECRGCKLTLEVLEDNHGAVKRYERVSFAGYQLDSAMGQGEVFSEVAGVSQLIFRKMKIFIAYR